MYYLSSIKEIILLFLLSLRDIFKSKEPTDIAGLQQSFCSKMQAANNCVTVIE